MSLLLQPLSWPAKLKLVEICQKPLPWKKWWKQQERLLRPIEINKADLYVMLCYMPTINLIIYTNIKLALFFFLALRVYIQPLSKLVFRLRTWCNQRLLINDTHLGFWFRVLQWMGIQNLIRYILYSQNIGVHGEYLYY